MEYYCSVCDYKTPFNKVFNKHIATNKHCHNTEIFCDNIELTRKYTGIYRFVCNKCNYKSNIKIHYNRHLNSKIHRYKVMHEKRLTGRLEVPVSMSSLFLN